MPWSIKNLMFHDKPVPLSNQRGLGYRKVWVYCGNPDCRHSAVLDVEHLPDETTFNELMPRMLCTVCDRRRCRCLHGLACAEMNGHEVKE